MPPTQAARKLLGAWYTPPELVDDVVDNVLRGFRPKRGRAVRVLDPACGDGRFLFAVERRLAALPERSIVYYLLVYQDGLGVNLEPLEYLTRLTTMANRPVYCWTARRSTVRRPCGARWWRRENNSSGR